LKPVGSVVGTPDIACNPPNWSFGTVVVGTGSDKIFALRNDGNGDLNVSSLTLTGTNASDFIIQSGGGVPFTIPPGGAATHDVTIRFSPAGAGSKEAWLYVASNDPDENPYSIGLSGTGEAGMTPSLIIVDGAKDSFYGGLTGPANGYLQFRSYAWNDNGKPSNDADLSAKIWTAWDSEWFFLYEEVKDDVLSASSANSWEDDCLELKVDPQPTDASTNSIWDARLTALGMGGAGVAASDELNSLQDSQKQWTRRTISGGYALELAVRWSAMKSGSETITPAVGNVFGMAINQHDNDGSGREATLQWAAVLLDAAWNTPKYLGTVKLLANNRLQFVARNNMTGVTNPVPYDGSNYTRLGVEDARPTPSGFNLEPNYPNPFNPTTTVAYTLKTDGRVRLAVVDVAGREIAVLSDGIESAGRHEAVFSGKDLTSGIYFCKLWTPDGILTRKMTLVK
jgi:hypothetical protein